MVKEPVVGPLVMRMLGFVVGGMVWQATLGLAEGSLTNLVYLHDGGVLVVNGMSLTMFLSLSCAWVLGVRGGADVTYGRGAPRDCRGAGGTCLDLLGRGTLEGAWIACAWREMKRGRGS